MLLIGISAAAFISTFLGGLFALKLRDQLHLVLGFSAGAILAVAFFDLLPESIEIVGEMYEVHFVTTLIAIGFVIFLLLDRFVWKHSHNDDTHDHSPRGAFSAGSIVFHSFIDGIGIGLAFAVSPTLGLTVAAAVLFHNFSDGINTVSMILRSGGEKSRAYIWLALDALAPVAGIIVAQFFFLPEEMIGLMLALFAGFFIYIGASDLLPESHHRHPVIWTTLATLAGMLLIFVAIQFGPAH
ncbi:ZIP family metal transporter [Candidatus Parcubacteria bacterium]|uniref:Permease n=1 Tax=Candidatus Kaiserbacteria bacterium CG10_big_fil_rev_8_21_14_0_10_47_16 TaxID=1974608 RepID=A0A2H0UEE9_9BACT|nr:ZIP family metal transporter [Candidatus Parcubacteria bacterium]PIR84793.1 MAG: hypothetical protein COU16_01240 [Candidatus Kaiserbacteria bacterium CG10_big_fil_rev_8_21_14_0_10_47_16]